MKKLQATLALLSFMALGAIMVPVQTASARTHSFQETCWNWKWKSNGELCSQCRTRRGDAYYSCLPNAKSCRGDISNQNGRLVCGRR